MTSATAEGDGSSATLNIAGTLTNAGTLTITVDKEAFDPAPQQSSTVEVRVRKNLNELNNQIEIKSNGEDVTDPVVGDELTASLAEAGQVTWSWKVNDMTSSGETATYRVDEADVGHTITFTATAAADNETYTGSASRTTGTVKRPSGSISAEFTSLVYAGTAVDGQKIKITATGLIFATDQETSYFTLGDGHADLSVSGVSRTGDNTVELALSGTPQTAGSFTITVSQDAFKYNLNPHSF